MCRKTTVAAVFCTLISLAHSGPNTLTYQGSLLSTGDTPVPNGNYRMQFALYDALAGGALKWQEVEPSVPVTQGLFAVTLGDGTPFASLFANNSNLWLEVAVDVNKNGSLDGAEIYTPRQKLSGAAWAMDADTLDGRHASGFWLLTGNAGITSGTHFLGTTDNKPLDLRANNVRALRIEPKTESPNLIGGFRGNNVNPGAVGAVIGGGGSSGLVNYVGRSYGTVGGGQGNTAIGLWATVAGGWKNSAAGTSATVSGGTRNLVIGAGSIIGGSTWITHSIPPDTTVVLQEPRMKYRGPGAQALLPTEPEWMI